MKVSSIAQRANFELGKVFIPEMRIEGRFNNRKTRVALGAYALIAAPLMVIEAIDMNGGLNIPGVGTLSVDKSQIPIMPMIEQEGGANLPTHEFLVDELNQGNISSLAIVRSVEGLLEKRFNKPRKQQK